MSRVSRSMSMSRSPSRSRSRSPTRRRRLSSSVENTPMPSPELREDIEYTIKNVKNDNYNLTQEDFDKLNYYYTTYTDDSEIREKILLVFAYSSPIAKIIYDSFTGEKQAKDLARILLSKRFLGKGKKKKTIRKKKGKRKKNSKKKK